MTFLELVKTILSRFFARDPEEVARRTELRKIYVQLSDRDGDWYRPRQGVVLPGFAESVLDFARLLKPLSDLMKATVANSDQRIAQRFQDFLVECRLSPAGLELRRSLAYEDMQARFVDSLDPETELDRMDTDFQSLLGELEGLGPARIDEELDMVAAFTDLSRYDFERLLALFDPGVSIENPKRAVDFAPVDGEQVLPELLDLHFVLDHFVFEAHLRENLLRLMERKSNDVGDARRKQVDKLVAKLDQKLVGSLDPARLLALARAIKGEPRFSPSVPRSRTEHFASYRQRIVAQYDRDRDRILRERRESTVSADIVGLFGSQEIAAVEGYDEDMDAYLRREGPDGFLWVKPLRILRTFVTGIFEPFVREPLKRILVEGYFDNKVFQNTVANLLYQCEKTAPRIADFERQLSGTGRMSTTALRRYVEEIRRGKDITAFLARLVEGINGMARDIVVDESSLFVMLGDAVRDIVADSKKPSPEIVTNIRTFGGARNKEILGRLSQGKDRLELLSRVMRSFGIAREAFGANAVQEAALRQVPAQEGQES